MGGKSPIEMLCPNITLFPVPPKVFGCSCFVHIPKQHQDKLDPKAIKCIFVGYPSTQKGYKCYFPGNGGKIFVTMHVTFHEDVPFYSLEGKEVIREERLGEHQGKLVPLVESLPPLHHRIWDKWIVTESKDKRSSQRQCQRLLRWLEQPKHYQSHCRYIPEKKQKTRPLFSSESSVDALNSDPQPPSDLDLPVALCKGTRSCVTRHPIQNFVSYNHLSPFFRAFVTKISSVNVLKSVWGTCSS